MSQLALPLKLDDHAVFESFWAGGNDATVAFLQALSLRPTPPGGWLWGAEASGKTHLLQALCERVGDRAVYLPFNMVAGSEPDILHGVASREYVCLDDVDLVAGQAQWELALFDLYNQAVEQGAMIIATASVAVRESRFELPDLVSRFTQLPVFNLHALDDQGRVEALQLRARHRGLDLPTETANFMLNRSRRDMASLYSLLDKLDSEALRAKRRLTIPFVRDVLAQES